MALHLHCTEGAQTTVVYSGRLVGGHAWTSVCV